MSRKSLLFLFSILFAYITLTLAAVHLKQSALFPSKAKLEPFAVRMTKKKRSPEEQRKFISFLQAGSARVKSSSLLQKSSNKITLGQEDDTGMIPLDNMMNTQYSGKIALGSPDNVFDAVFDTGSTAFYINSEFCTTYACEERRQYNPLDSQTLLLTDPLLTMQVIYGSGVVEGVLAKEDVYVQGLKAPQFVLFLIDDQAGVLENAAFDAVVGLSFPDEQDGIEIISIFDAVKDQLPEPYFSFRLGRNEEPDSYLLFGGFILEDMASELVWHDVIDPNYWMIQITEIWVGDTPIDFCRKYRCGVVIDSGTSVLSAPELAMDEMQSLIGDVTCENMEELPVLTFVMGDIDYELVPEEYTVSLDYDMNTYFYEHPEDVYACSGTFSPMDLQTSDGTVVFIFGDTFLSKYYAVFDTERRRIGLALQKR